MLCVVRVFFVRMNEIDGEDGVRVRGFFFYLMIHEMIFSSNYKLIAFLFYFSFIDDNDILIDIVKLILSFVMTHNCHM